MGQAKAGAGEGEGVGQDTGLAQGSVVSGCQSVKSAGQALCLATFDAVPVIPGASPKVCWPAGGRQPVQCWTAVHWCRLFARQLENLSRGCSALLALLLLLDTGYLFHARREMAARTGAALPHPSGNLQIILRQKSKLNCFLTSV